jgi:hypothetical protein
MIPVLVATIVVVPVPHFVAVPVCLVAVAVSVSVPSNLSAAVSPPVIRVVVLYPQVVSVMVVPYRAVVETRVVILAETWVVAESRFILASPFPIFPLALTAQPVVLDIVEPAFSQPFPVVRIAPVIPVAAVIRIV